MQPIPLEAAREATERKNALKREQDRMEEERENKERRVDLWVKYVSTPEDEAVEEMYLH